MLPAWQDGESDPFDVEPDVPVEQPAEDRELALTS